MPNQELIHNTGTGNTYQADDYQRHLASLQEVRGDALAGAHDYGFHESEQTAEAMAHAADVYLTDAQREEKGAAEALAAADLAKREGRDFDALIQGIDAKKLKRNAGKFALEAYEEARKEGEWQDRQELSEAKLNDLHRTTRRRQEAHRAEREIDDLNLAFRAPSASDSNIKDNQ